MRFPCGGWAGRILAAREAGDFKTLKLGFYVGISLEMDSGELIQTGPQPYRQRQIPELQSVFPKILAHLLNFDQVSLPCTAKSRQQDP
jgi:hypothetical protein